jgi:hypothetical protein
MRLNEYIQAHNEGVCEGPYEDVTHQPHAIRQIKFDQRLKMEVALTGG